MKRQPERTLEQQAAAQRPGARRAHMLLALSVVLLAAAGVAGAIVYPLFARPAAEGAALLLLGAGAAMAAFFSPCSLPSLLSVLARHTDALSTEAAGRAAIRRGLVASGVLSAGATAVILLAGVAVASSGELALGSVSIETTAGRIVRAVFGAAFAGLGLMQLGVLPRPWSPGGPAPRDTQSAKCRLRRRRPVLGLWLFGAGYPISGFSWTGAILAGLVGYGFVVGSLTAALLAFAAAALVFSILIAALALAMATSRNGVAFALRARASDAKRADGWILVLVGVWLLALAIWTLRLGGIGPG